MATAQHQATRLQDFLITFLIYFASKGPIRTGHRHFCRLNRFWQILAERIFVNIAAALEGSDDINLHDGMHERSKKQASDQGSSSAA